MAQGKGSITMVKGGGVILLEFNELSPVLTERFIGEGKLPNFRRFHDEAGVWVTEAEEQPPFLEPWIQWITVHSGASYREHGIFNLDDGHRLAEPSLWDVLSAHGYSSWICGSMNVQYRHPIDGWVLPDPWTTRVAPSPEALLPYFDFVRRHVLEYTNDRVPVTLADRLGFLRFMWTHGLSLRSVAAIARQLIGERMDAGTRWRRAVLLDRLQFDLFRSHWREARPDFSTFFLNSTAHFQHFYWRNMEPRLFAIRPTAEEQAHFEDAILFGYQQMDALLGEFLALAGRDTTLVLCTALSQQPCLAYEESGGKVIYRPRDFEQLLAFAGVDAPHRVAPVMAEEFYVYLEDEQAAEDVARRLSALRCGAHPALTVRREGAALFCGCKIHGPLPPKSILEGGTAAAAPFFDVFYQVEGMKSGMHHPDGMLWIRTPERRQRIHPERLPLTEVFPTLLGLFGLPAPRRAMERPPVVSGPGLKISTDARPDVLTQTM